jgi:hypothetical protein
MATSEAGNAMYPVSWKEYKDPETGGSESRKRMTNWKTGTLMHSGGVGVAGIYHLDFF